MQVINISHKIDEAENLILDIKPVLQTYGTFEYQILAKGKDLPTFVLQIYPVSKNVWTSLLVNVVQKITAKGFYFSMTTIENEQKISLNIII
jgi:protein gp37